MLPGAYVRTGPELEDRSPWAQLRVYCAGVWHNLVRFAGLWVVYLRCQLVGWVVGSLVGYASQVLALVCWGLLSQFALAMHVGYATGRGAVVAVVPPHSPLLGHVRPGAAVTAIEAWNVASVDDYLAAVSKLAHRYAVFVL